MSLAINFNSDNTVEKALTLAEQSGILRLSKRTLKSFPPIAAKFNLSDLLTLDLSQNKLTEYPKQLSNCQFLSVSNCCHNLLKSLPDDFDCLTNLLQLDLSYNCFVEFPKSLCRLLKLEVLIICNNKLTALPDECGDLLNLVVLDASNNEIRSATSRIANLKQLKILKLRNNALETVPSDWSSLRLRCLDLGANELSSLPPTYSEMRPGLTQLNLDLNPMRCPPAHVCARGPSHVLKYLAVCSLGSELPWHYAKSKTASKYATAERRHQSDGVKISSDIIDSKTRVIIAETEDLRELNGDPSSSPVIVPLQQLTQRRISNISSGSSSANQALNASVTAVSSASASVQFSSSNSVLQRLEQQSSRLGGSSTLPRRRPGTVAEIGDSSVGSAGASASASPSIVAEAAAAAAADSSGSVDLLRTADESAVAAMRSIVERRLGVRLPDRPDRLAERLIDGQLLGQMAELSAGGQDGDNVAGSVSPGGHGRLLDLYQRLGVAELPAAQTRDPVMQHLVRMARAFIAMEARIKRNGNCCIVRNSYRINAEFD